MKALLFPLCEQVSGRQRRFLQGALARATVFEELIVEWVSLRRRLIFAGFRQLTCPLLSIHFVENGHSLAVGFISENEARSCYCDRNQDSLLKYCPKQSMFFARPGIFGRIVIDYALSRNGLAEIRCSDSDGIFIAKLVFLRSDRKAGWYEQIALLE